MLAEALHILAGCIWVGVVLALTVMLWRPTVQGLERRVLLRMIGGPLAVVLLASVGIVLVSWLVQRGPSGRDGEWSRHDRVWPRAVDQDRSCCVVLLVLGALNAIKLHGLQLPMPQTGRSRDLRA